MSVIDTRRPPSATGRLKRIFSSSQSQVGLGKKNSPVTVPKSIPGQGRELSITELEQVSGKIGRYIRVYCGNVCPSAIFKTVFVQNDDTVANCVAKVLILLEKEGEHVMDMCTLYEVIGRLPANSKAINEANVVIDPGETFTELSARSLPTNVSLMEVFSLMAPAPGLCRRLELRRYSASPPNGIDSPIPQQRARSASFLRKASPRTIGNVCVAPYCPFLLLIKGSRPEKDLIIHSFYNICRGKLNAVTMGTSERDDIRLYLWPEEKNGRGNLIINGNGYSSTKAPIRFEAKTKSIWMSVVSTFNAIQPDNPLTITLNWETLTDCYSFPVNRCLEPGDILRVESRNLTYVFIYKDSETVPEHKLSLGFLTLPQLPSTKPPIGVNGSRSAARTARIDALVRRNSNSSNPGASSVFPSVADVESVIEVLFPRISTRSRDPNWGENGGILPDVGVSAGCFAHLLRSLFKYGVDTGINEDGIVKAISHALTRELDNLNKLASQHLIPAIWEAGFCTYLAQYLTPGWLKTSGHHGSVSSNTVGPTFPKIIVTERRRSLRLRSMETGSNSSTPNTNTTTDSPSDVFAPQTSRPRQLYPTNGGIESDHATPNFENLPLFLHLREMLSNEAEIVMNEAVQQSLSAGSRKVTKLCCLFGGASVGADTVRQIREAQASLFDRLDWTGCAITQALTAGTHRTESPLSVNTNGAIRLTQAQPYNDRGDSRMSAATPAKEHDIGDSNGGDSSIGRNNSSVIDSDVEGERDVTSPSGLSSLNNDDEIRSTPGEEDDTGFGSNNSGGSTKSAQQRLESVFFCRFLVGLTKLIIEDFVNNRELLINWETGTQLLNLVKALRKWMHNAGVHNYNDALQLLNEFSRLMATPRQELTSMSWIELRNARPNIPPSLLFFLLKEYENGRGLSEAPQWIPNEDTIMKGDPMESVNEYVRIWQESERLYVQPKHQMIEPIYRPPDLATLFNTARSKFAVESFDNALAERYQSFRWNTLIKTYPPPGRIVQDSGFSINSARSHNSNLVPELIRGKQHNSSDSSDFRDFAELNTEINSSRRPSMFDTLEIPRPKISTECPSRSILANRSGNYRRMTETELGGRRSRGAMSEIGGVKRADVQRVVPVAGGGFRSRGGVYGLGLSSPHLEDLAINNGTMSFSRTRNFNRRGTPRGTALSVSSLNVSQSLERKNFQEVQKIRDDWSEFKRSLSRPATPSGSTIDADAETLNGSLLAYPSNLMIQSAYNFGTFPRGRRADSLSSFGLDLNMRKSQQSLISVDLDRPNGTAVMNVILEKIATETYGMKFVEGHMTRFGQLGVYVKSITPETAASRGNIEIGDRILAINGKDVTGLTFKETCDLLKESVTRVTLTIHRGLVINPDDLQIE